jgi:signal transduction histidine kinase
MVVSINIVMFIFKVMHNKTSRTTFTMMEHHRDAAKVKSSIIGIIGHDLKNPLTVIHLRTSMAQVLLERGRTDKVARELDKIELSTNKLNELLQSLLNWAQTGSKSEEMKQNSIVDCVQNSLFHCEDLAKQKGIKITKDVDESSFVFDLNMVETILRNILVNAIKFTSTGKEVFVSGKKFDQNYSMAITDQGMGMSLDQIKMILSGENINSSDGTSGEKGTGLGMQLTHEFIKKHNANFDIQSKLGEGTSFIVTFPLSIS